MRRFMLFVSCCALATFACGPAWCEDERPDASKTLKSVVKALHKESARGGYNIALQVAGGYAKGKDHAITQQRVDQKYSADFYRGLMRLPEPQVIRTTKKGAIFNGDLWMQLLAVPEGALVERLFHFPHSVMADTVTKGGTVRWSEGETKTVIDGEGLSGVARQVKTVGDKLLVEVPAKVALERYTTIQNSGCTASGG